ncbi:MAG: tetratricopeptide repeat protein, partial [Gemmatimonadales bacterium]
MNDDIRALTAQLAADPASLVFLPLGEALRRRGQHDVAQKVALAGLGRYPHLPDAHDLFARILVDRKDFERAFDEWDMTLRLDPQHAGALKGLGFLYYKAGDLARALELLEAAQVESPDDPSVVAAMARVRAESGTGPASDAPPLAPQPASDADPVVAPTSIFAGLEGAENGLLLVDTAGLRLGGGLLDPAGVDVADVVAAHLAGVSREAQRTVRLLDLGTWEAVIVEAPKGNAAVVPANSESLLLLMRDGGVPLGRLHVLADRAA